MDNFEGLILTKIHILTSQIGSKFKFSLFEIGQNQTFDKFEGLKVIKNKIWFLKYQQVWNFDNQRIPH